MYCNKCGKEIEQGTLCPECAAPVQETPAQEQPQTPYVPVPTPAPTYTYSYTPPVNGRMLGFGKALASTIMATVGFFFAYFGMIIVIVEAELGEFGGSMVMLMLGTPLIVLPLIFGISSIKTFNAIKTRGVKLIPTLILGIVGLSTAAVSAFLAFMGLLVGMFAV